VPEYLAPGVYVEETSFRAKSIEGVSTSTTGFVGPTRKGPIGEVPELITSFGDFERIYGGFADLELGINYLAHAVRAYFDNGGSRLYVARVYAGDPETGKAASPWMGNANDNANKVRFRARFPGKVGNGKVTVNVMNSAATVRGMKGAPEGAVLRREEEAATPAQLVGGKPPFSLQDSSTLKLAGFNNPITFHGKQTEVLGDVLDEDQDIVLGSNNKLTIALGSGPQHLTLPEVATPRAVLLQMINNQLVGGSADVTADNKLVIRSDIRGNDSFINVLEPAFGLAAGEAPKDPDNNVGNLLQVTWEEIHDLLQKGTSGAVSAELFEGKLRLKTTATGDQAILQVENENDPLSAHEALGLGTGLKQGGAGQVKAVYVKTGNHWKRSVGSDLSTGSLKDTDRVGDFLTANVLTVDADGDQKFFEDLGLAPGHPRWIGSVLGNPPSRRIDALENLFAIDIGSQVDAGQLVSILTAPGSFPLIGGNDGGEPGDLGYEEALKLLARIENISIVAAPGHSAYSGFQAIQDKLIQHVERRRAYRVAVLDTPRDQTTDAAVETRSKIDSTRAALYYPWVVTANPLVQPGDETIARELTLPPSGFVCGIYARNDIERSVAKAPANEIVRGALRFETDVNFAEQEGLNPAGVNCLRFFPGRGYRVWGARTASSDPEWKYINVRRYFLFLEQSIDRGTQWAVFENNGERLWANIRETIESFLYNEWRSGNLLGGTPAEAYFVRCDRSTMTQNDLDNGRLVCLIGVAVLKPAEFVIFRIGQKTADART
jgi:phage tail sheath protein FI